MENFDANAGTNKLANVLSDRMRRENDTSLCLDFGEIQGNGSLITNTFPVAIPKGQYSVCRHVGGLSVTTSMTQASFITHATSTLSPGFICGGAIV